MLVTIAMLAALASAPSPNVATPHEYTQECVDSLYAVLDSAAVVIEQRFRTTGRLRTYDTRATGGIRFSAFEEDLGIRLPAPFSVRSTWRITVGTFTRDTNQATIITDEQQVCPPEKWFKIAMLNPSAPGHLPIVSLSVRLEQGKPSRMRRHEFHDDQLHVQFSTEGETNDSSTSTDSTTFPTGETNR